MRKRAQERLKVTRDNVDAVGYRVLWVHTADRRPVTTQDRATLRTHPRVMRVVRRSKAHRLIVELFPRVDATTAERDEVLAELAAML